MDQQVSKLIAAEEAVALRPLGAVEQYFWLSDQNSPKHFCMTLQVSGETTSKCWREALDAVALRHPLLRATIARDDFGVPTFHRLDRHPIPLRVLKSGQPHDWQTVVSDELLEPFPQSGAPLVRAVLFHCANFATLVMTAHHAVADGMSIAFVLRDILKVVGGGSLTSLALSPAQETIASTWNMSVPALDPPQSAPALMLERTHGKPVVSGLRLSKELSSSIRTEARKHATTVHGALLAAMILAGRRLSQKWSNAAVRAVSPVNLRSTLDIGDDCVVSIVFPISGYAPDAETGLWDLARNIRYDLAHTRSREAIAGAFDAFQRIVDAKPTVDDIAAIELQACASEMMLSNLGEAPIADVYGHVRVEALWGPSVFVGIEGEQMIGAATVSGSIHLLHTSFTPIPGLLDAAKELLCDTVE